MKSTDREPVESRVPLNGSSTSDDHDGGPVNTRGSNIEKRTDDAHRRVVTLTLIVFLAVIIIGHYILLVVLEWNGKDVQAVNTAFNTALPVVSGLTGSAITYYFAKRSG